MKKIICSLFPFKLIFPLFLLFISVGLAGQGKTPISRAEELPRRTYALTGKVSAVYQDDEQIRNMADYAYQVLSADLEQFDIQDKSTLAGYHSILMLAEFSKGLYPDVLKRLEALKQLEDKEEERATIGLTMSAVIRAIKPQAPVQAQLSNPPSNANMRRTLTPATPIICAGMPNRPG